MAPRPSQVARKSARFAEEAKALGAQIRKLRLKQKLTLEELAGRSNMDLKHLQRAEAAQLNLTLVTLIRVSKGLGVPVAKLFQRPRQRP